VSPEGSESGKWQGDFFKAAFSADNALHVVYRDPKAVKVDYSRQADGPNLGSRTFCGRSGSQ
jgi:hypothetical protein